MIYFDRKNLKILKYIKRCGCKGVTWSKLQKRFGEDLANAFFLTALTKQSYIVTKDENGKWLSDKYDFSVIHLGFRSYSSPKGNELIEKRCFDFWKWTIPIVISVAALIVSVVSALQKPTLPQTTQPTQQETQQIEY